MAMKTRTKTSAILLGALIGALIMAAFSAFDWWIFVYTDPGSGFLGPNSNWAPVAAIVGGLFGLLAGAVLGAFLSYMRRGSLFGTLAGAVAGLAIVIIVLAREGLSTGDTRTDLMFAGFVPVGAISGFLTSRAVSAIAASAERKRHSHAVFDLEQDEGDESR
jgi:ABC-type xylose transport system permease subunit